ncbi:hypothetical protein EW145_g2740 [Phellinidium pouzarii]|uniref:NAD(P)-binding protein n=1 Tax=Phellinidium pouzarii TaxID=167371 RepID=A0A4S4L9M9_9AGAM|nr:hypothetical protein EW145_g2740 [Phellinidium pouzarii]
MPSYVVTGASRGLGLEFVQQLGSSPENIVFALVRNKKTADKLIALSRSNVHIVQADITDVNALKLAAQEVSKITGGKLDVLINNAALVEPNHRNLNLDEYPDEKTLEKDLFDSFHVNAIGVIHTTNIFLPLLRAGSVKKVASLSTGIADLDTTIATGYSLAGPYCISKAALNMAVSKYALKYKNDGFVFLSISPGLVATDAMVSEHPSDEEIAEVKDMIAGFTKVYPDFTGPITAEESIRSMLSVIDEATVETSGAFLSHKGNKEWL